jgi:hypothetical protein
MDNLKQNNRMRDIVAQRYCMVKIPGAEPGYSGTQSGVTDRDKVTEELG